MNKLAIIFTVLLFNSCSLNNTDSEINEDNAAENSEAAGNFAKPVYWNIFDLLF